MSEVCQPTLSYDGPTSSPGVPAGTMMLDSSLRTSPSGPTVSPVTAVIVTRLVMGVPELVMNCLDPSITHSSPSSRAVVRVPPASDPAPASVSPNAASARPASRSGSHRSCCSREPCR